MFGFLQHSNQLRTNNQALSEFASRVNALRSPCESLDMLKCEYSEVQVSIGILAHCLKFEQDTVCQSPVHVPGMPSPLKGGDPSSHPPAYPGLIIISSTRQTQVARSHLLAPYRL